ncbi:MAG: hypothetical protein RLZZ501_168 [Pseudomonadota bacterium]|jgi:hypothetical protein
MMTLDEAKRILDLLADGVDPETGNTLPDDHILRHDGCRRALSLVLNQVDGPSLKPPLHAASPRLDHLGRIDLA